MTDLIRGPLIRAKSSRFDSARWDDYKPRPEDIIIAAYPKCGTTWAQCIVGMLIFQSDTPFPIQYLSPWPEEPDPSTSGTMVALDLAESQTHRRFLKSHLPYDALPVYEGVKFIHVARDGRDAAMSFHNQKINHTDEVKKRIAKKMMKDYPNLTGKIFGCDPDPAVHFHDWILGTEDHLGDLACGFWHMENSYWAARNDPNMLLVHYADMKKDLEGEMRRIAEFLDIEVAEDLWPKLIEAACFDSMKAKAEQLMPTAGERWKGGGDTFLHKGTNGRWRDVVNQEDLALYDVKVKSEFSPELAHWIEFGRLG